MTFRTYVACVGAHLQSRAGAVGSLATHAQTGDENQAPGALCSLLEHRAVTAHAPSAPGANEFELKRSYRPQITPETNCRRDVLFCNLRQPWGTQDFCLCGVLETLWTVRRWMCRAWKWRSTPCLTERSPPGWSGCRRLWKHNHQRKQESH